MVEKREVYVMCMLQIFFKKRCMLVSDAKEACLRIFGKGDDETFNAVLAEMGQRLNILKMQIKTFTHFNDGLKYVALVNTVEDEAAKQSSTYSFAQLQFFNHVVESIACSPSDKPGACSIASRAALNLDITGGTQMSQLTQEQMEGQKVHLSPTEKQATLQRLQADFWLGSDDDGNVTIGPRTFLELKSHLLNIDLPPETQQAWNDSM